MERAEESNILWKLNLPVAQYFSLVLLMFVMLVLGLQSHRKSAVLLAQSSPPFQHHFCYGKTQVQQKEGK